MFLPDQSSFLAAHKYRHIVDKYDGYRYIESYTFWNQPLIMISFFLKCQRA